MSINSVQRSSQCHPLGDPSRIGLYNADPCRLEFGGAWRPGLTKIHHEILQPVAIEHGLRGFRQIVPQHFGSILAAEIRESQEQAATNIRF